MSIPSLQFAMSDSSDMQPLGVPNSAPTNVLISEPLAPLEVTVQYERTLSPFLLPPPEITTSITDSDSVGSFTGSEAGSQVSEQHSNTSQEKPTSTANTPNKDSVEIRAVHNVSEQHRRKYLKSCFFNLYKEVVAESNAKASHLLIITSALEAIQRVREQDFQLRRDHERAAEEQRQLQRRFDEIVRDILSVDPEFNVNAFLTEADLGNPEGYMFHPFDRQEPFQIEETVEVVSPPHSQKRQSGEISEDTDGQTRKPVRGLQGGNASKRKDAKKAKIR